MSDNNTDRRTATQRIEDLERVLTGMYQAVQGHKQAIEELGKALNPLRGDMGLVKEALKLLNRRLEAVIQVARPETGITQDSTSEVLLRLNVQDLTTQTQAYLSNGQIVPTETVALDSFLVGEEVNSEGVVVNPRLQFRLDSQDADTQTALTGKKVGDTVSFGEGKLNFRLLELYQLVPSKAPESTQATAAETPTTEAPVTETPVTEAPAAEVSTPESPTPALPAQEPAAVQENYTQFQNASDGAAGTNASTASMATA